jgi:hypothetical protein
MSTLAKKNLGGRPKVVLSQEQIAEIEELAQRLSITQIADYLGISEKSFLNIRERQPEVSTAYKKGKSRAIQFVASKLMEKVQNGDTTATIFFLKTQAGWSEKQQLDVTTNAANNLPLIVLKTNKENGDAIAN